MRNHQIQHQRYMIHKESPNTASTTYESWGITRYSINDLSTTCMSNHQIQHQRSMIYRESPDTASTIYESWGITWYSINDLEIMRNHQIPSTIFEPWAIIRYSINDLRIMINHQIQNQRSMNHGESPDTASKIYESWWIPRFLIIYWSFVRVFGLFRCSVCSRSWKFTQAKMYIFSLRGSSDIPR